jgi:hypothetical protein
MSDLRTQSDLPTPSEWVEGVLFYPISVVVSATMLPGFTLCIPALLFGTALILIPLAAVALVVVVVAAIVAAPFALVRGVRALHERRAASRSRSRRPVIGRAMPARPEPVKAEA